MYFVAALVSIIGALATFAQGSPLMERGNKAVTIGQDFQGSTTSYTTQISIGNPPVKMYCAIDSTTHQTWISEGFEWIPNDPSKGSKTAKKTGKYFTGAAAHTTGVKGPVYTDQITFAGKTAKSIEIAYATRDYNRLETCVIGLAPSSDASTFVTAFANQGLIPQNLWALDFVRANFTLGGYDIAQYGSKVTNSLGWTSIFKDGGIWTSGSPVNISIGDRSGAHPFPPPSASYAYYATVDTLSFFLTVSVTVADAFHLRFNGTQKIDKGDHYEYIYPCGLINATSTDPKYRPENFDFYLFVEGFKGPITIPANRNNWGYNADPMYCNSLIAGSKDYSSNSITLGTSILLFYYNIFDSKNQRFALVDYHQNDLYD